MCGEQLTTCDLSVYVLGSSMTEDGGSLFTKVLDGCPRLQTLVALVGKHEKVAAWNLRHAK